MRSLVRFIIGADTWIQTHITRGSHFLHREFGFTVSMQRYVIWFFFAASGTAKEILRAQIQKRPIMGGWIAFIVIVSWFLQWAVQRHDRLYERLGKAVPQHMVHVARLYKLVACYQLTNCIFEEMLPLLSAGNAAIILLIAYLFLVPGNPPPIEQRELSPLPTSS